MVRTLSLAAFSLALASPALAEDLRVDPDGGNNTFAAVFDAKLESGSPPRAPRSPATSATTRRPASPPAAARSRSRASRSTTRTPRPSTSSSGTNTSRRSRGSSRRAGAPRGSRRRRSRRCTGARCHDARRGPGRVPRARDPGRGPAAGSRGAPRRHRRPARRRAHRHLRRHVLWRLADALREDYPKLAALLGDERFLALAEAYARAHPSDHPDLGRFGRHLPAFLRTLPASDRADLADLATLEWARSEVFFEAPAEPAGDEGLAALAPDTFIGARLELVPALRLLVLDHDAAAVWSRLEDGAPAPQPAAGPDAVVVWRRGYDVFHARIDLDEARAVEAALAGEPLVRVCASFERRDDPAAAAFAALCSWIDEGWIAAIHARRRGARPAGS